MGDEPEDDEEELAGAMDADVSSEAPESDGSELLMEEYEGEDDGDEQPEKKADASPDEGSVLESVFVDGEGDDDPDAGFELDDAQAGEVRHVFLATLPQYLEPVQQMVKKLGTPDEDEALTIRALDKTLESIQSAAVRVDVEDVRATLEGMRKQVAQLLVAEDDERSGLLEGILADTDRLHLIAGGEVPGAADGAAESTSPTIFAALSDVEDFDRSILEKLTAAGLITVDQLQMARPDEIMAVSGLDAPTVDRLLDALGVVPKTRAPRDATGPEDPLRQAARERVDAEAALEKVRVEVQRLRASATRLRGDVAAAQQRRDSLNEDVAREQERLANAMMRLAEARADRENRREDVAEARRSIERVQRTIRALRRDRLVLLDEQSELTSAVADLGKRVKDILDAADPGTEPPG